MSSHVISFTRVGSYDIPVYGSCSDESSLNSEQSNELTTSHESNLNCKVSESPLIPIFSIDGGGVRGILPLTYLAEIERRTKLAIAKLGRIFAGASIGGLLATALNVPDPRDRTQPKITARLLEDEFTILASKIFTKTVSEQIPGHDLAFSKYGTQSLMEVIHQYVGEEMFANTFNEVVVPSWEKSTRNAVLFRTSQARDKGIFSAWRVKDVINAAVRAPTYFDPYNPRKYNANIPASQGFCFCDGGLIANNPSLLAYNVADELYGCNRNLYMISLGTGIQKTDPKSCDHSHWGEIAWAWDLAVLNDTFDGTSDMADAMTLSRFTSAKKRENYIRIQPFIEGSPLDDKSVIPALRKLAEEHIAQNGAYIQKICDTLETAAAGEPPLSVVETY